MLLILTNSGDVTVNYLVPLLQKGGIPFVRLDTDCLVREVELSYKANSPLIKIQQFWYNASDFSHVWYRRPEKLKDSRFDGSAEGRYTLSEWAESLEGIFAHIPRKLWINHPAFNTLASHKMEQLTVAKILGFNIPDTIVTQNAVELREFFEHHDSEIIVKPMATGYIERESSEVDSLIYTNRVHENDLNNLGDLKVCPTLFQQFISRSFDIRITVIDRQLHSTRIFADTMNKLQGHDIRRNNMSGVSYENVQLPFDVRERVLQLMDHYGLRFAAIDMAVTKEGDWYFFEVNPNGQWAWLDLCAGSNIAASFVQSFTSKLDGGRVA